MKKIIIIFIIVVLVGVGVYFLIKNLSNNNVLPQDQEMVNHVDMSTTTIEVNDYEGLDETDNDLVQGDESETVIGKSVNGYDITAYHYGDGDTKLLFVGGFHGGYEWNTVLLAYELMDYLEESSNVIPDNIQVTVIPVLNPDGLNEVVGTTGRFIKTDVPSSKDDTVPGRFNGNNVDLNRNFDCDWQSNGVWQDTSVDGGNEVFSEPESKAFRDYIESLNPNAVVVWYSAADGVFASNCHDGVLDETNTITNLYADASGYPAYEEFDFYEITGDAVNWLAKQNVPAISVLLSTHEDIEWDKNKDGIKALFEYYSE